MQKKGSRLWLYGEAIVLILYAIAALVARGVWKIDATTVLLALCGAIVAWAGVLVVGHRMIIGAV